MAAPRRLPPFGRVRLTGVAPRQPAVPTERNTRASQNAIFADPALRAWHWACLNGSPLPALGPVDGAPD